uniref:Charged multivesicular body protein 6 n=1 Tax=Chromera velia CCMP2878 TaxID=1169474 RepID=A0A0G4FT67_9ALVE|mmetsp:Transcript_24329/g.47761  ORF Transcript_24329/g.47761 Transcript_24329/m.47761 type:complete len:232 (-) Transcript_24329:393-1088(-)|eukprot:Cvel_18620.t1-p1 / transcript=Cvel_18620.t1 / gene=Cvel_18620 / organism=Chromera_velia_CCMP2878 / gene_product=Charged multivesicular body protein 6-A, putative / transcript_product=Charged multivesicular body protein 6-A, putative / location=Cvel_scaffold1554:29379-31374(+) / protein_length=231 / sequence_SO=supercontig / SO=protein_coding / is_pseudo=false
MGNLFGKRRRQSDPGDEKITDADRAILDLKNQKDQLTIHKRKLAALIPKDVEAAKKMIAEGRKQLALLALRKKKHHEKLVQDCENHLMMVEEMIGRVEMQQLESVTVSALAAGNTAVKKYREEVTVDYVANLVDESEEGRLHVQEIDAELARAGVTADDSAVLEELRQIEELEALNEVDKLPSVPAAPVGEGEQTATAQEAEAGKETEKEPVKANQKAEKEKAKQPVALPG